MDPDKRDIVETGVLTASGERWSQAEARFAVLAPLLEMHSVRSEAVDDAAQRLGLSRRQVYTLVGRLRNGTGTVTDLLTKGKRYDAPVEGRRSLLLVERRGPGVSLPGCRA